MYVVGGGGGGGGSVGGFLLVFLWIFKYSHIRIDCQDTIDMNQSVFFFVLEQHKINAVVMFFDGVALHKNIDVLHCFIFVCFVV